MKLLEGLQVVSTALNLPGPAACARLRDLGASVAKIEPPSGDPFERFCPSWYARLHERIEVGRLDLKSESGRSALARRLETADLLVTAQRPAALGRLGLDPACLARFPRLCHVAITGHAPPDDGVAGHDLTYMAEHGLVLPPHLPVSLFADIAGAERAVSTALALVIARERGGPERAANAALVDAVRALAMPLSEGLTARGALLGGGFAGYNLYRAKNGWIALAALEPHFAERLTQSFALKRLDHDGLAELFATHDADYWEAWAREHDLPIAAVRDPDPTRRNADMQIKDHAFLVTGGGSGLGAACAAMLAAAGGKVVVADLNAPKQSSAGTVRFIKCRRHRRSLDAGRGRSLRLGLRRDPRPRELRGRGTRGARRGAQRPPRPRELRPGREDQSRRHVQRDPPRRREDERAARRSQWASVA